VEYNIIVFLSRSGALKCYQILKKAGLDVSVISTPKISGLGCGICVKIKPEDFIIAKRIVTSYLIDGFVGFYEIKKQLGKLVANKIS
jgi:hypothetical protein